MIEHLRDAMRRAGLDYARPLLADGKLHRFKAQGDKARNSWYVLHAGSPAAGVFGCWRRQIKETWHDRNGNLSQAEWQQVRRQWQEAEAQQKAETAARQKKARQTAARIFERSRPVTSHLYLAAKHVQPHGELRERSGLLVLPLRDINGKLHSLQLVASDNRFDGERNKTFLHGGRIQGCLYTVADKADGPLAVCEGYATGASVHEATGYATVCAMNCGNLLAVAQAARELWPQREIIIAADNDQWTDGNPGLTEATAAAKAIRAKLGIPQFKDTSSKPTDFNDLATAEGLDVVKAEIGAAAVPEENDADTYARLAELSPADYDRCRKDEAAALRIRVDTLDTEVAKLRGSIGGDLQGCAVDVKDVEPWPDAVEGAAVINAIANTFTRYLALPEGAADAMALWAAHTHCYEAFEITPRLNLTSPEKGCGKTTLRDVLALFVPRSLATENMSAAVLFRVVDKLKPVLLADEYDSWLRDNEELRGLFNAGHRRGGQALRCEGDNHEVRAFRVFAPAVLCGIGALPGTLHDRSISVRLNRARPGEVAAQYDSRKTDTEKELCRKLARWAAEKRKSLESCDPQLPEGAYNRLADNWQPLFAIAKVAGGDWPDRAAKAFAKLTAANDLDAHGIGTRLLADIAAVFAAERTDKLPSAALAEALSKIEGRPWAEFGQARKPISANQLATKLRPFKVSPDKLRFGDKTLNGYHRDYFTEAFARYLPPGWNNGTCRASIDENHVLETEHKETLFHPESAQKPNNDGLCSVVPVQEPEPVEDMALL